MDNLNDLTGLTDEELGARLRDVAIRAVEAKATVGITCGTCGDLIGAVAHVTDVAVVGVAHNRVAHSQSTEQEPR